MAEAAPALPTGAASTTKSVPNAAITPPDAVPHCSDRNEKASDHEAIGIESSQYLRACRPQINR
jgi:hypothetical protein